MSALLDRLGDPSARYDAVHVVGTKGKSTAARTIAALLRAEGSRAARTPRRTSRGWGERLETDAERFEQAVARVRADAEALGATQFEIFTAAAFAEFAARGVDVAVVEAGLGGRLDATNVLDAAVVLLTNVGLEHTEVLGETREEIAPRSWRLRTPGAVVVLPDEEFAPLVRRARGRLGGARTAAEAYLGRPTEAEVQVTLAGRLELRGDEVGWPRYASAAVRAPPSRYLVPGDERRELLVGQHDDGAPWRNRQLLACDLVAGVAEHLRVLERDVRQQRRRARRARWSRRAGRRDPPRRARRRCRARRTRRTRPRSRGSNCVAPSSSAAGRTRATRPLEMGLGIHRSRSRQPRDVRRGIGAGAREPSPGAAPRSCASRWTCRSCRPRGPRRKRALRVAERGEERAHAVEPERPPARAQSDASRQSPIASSSRR